MKKFISLSLVFIALLSIPSIYGQTVEKESGNPSSGKIEAYYFHMTTRCVTCKAVEAEARKDLEMLYGGKVSFKSINIEDDSSKAIAEKLNISGQTLLLVKGDKKINLTNEGFLYAVNNPEKLKSIIREKVDGLLKL